MTFRDFSWLTALLVLLLASGERESDLRLRLEQEREFSEAVAWEATSRMADALGNAQ